MFNSMLVHMYTHVGSICFLTPMVVIVARTMANMIVRTTSENIADKAIFCCLEIRILCKMMNGIDVTCTISR